MQYSVTFFFEGTLPEVEYIVNRIVENYEPVSMSAIEECEDDEPKDEDTP